MRRIDYIYILKKIGGKVHKFTWMYVRIRGNLETPPIRVQFTEAIDQLRVVLKYGSINPSTC